MANEAERAETIAPASPMARVLFAAVVVVLLTAAFVGSRFLGKLNDWLVQDLDTAIQRFETLIAWLAALSLPVLIAGLFAIRSGWRSATSERFPPRGMWVLVDTPVETGARARFRGRMLIVGGFLMCAAAIGLPIVLWYIAHSVVGAA